MLREDFLKRLPDWKEYAPSLQGNETHATSHRGFWEEMPECLATILPALVEVTSHAIDADILNRMVFRAYEHLRTSEDPLIVTARNKLRMRSLHLTESDDDKGKNGLPDISGVMITPVGLRLIDAMAVLLNSLFPEIEGCGYLFKGYCHAERQALDHHVVEFAAHVFGEGLRNLTYNSGSALKGKFGKTMLLAENKVQGRFVCNIWRGMKRPYDDLSFVCSQEHTTGYILRVQSCGFALSDAIAYLDDIIANWPATVADLQASFKPV